MRCIDPERSCRVPEGLLTPLLLLPQLQPAVAPFEQIAGLLHVGSVDESCHISMQHMAAC
jgi:hypothetical protein